MPDTFRPQQVCNAFVTLCQDNPMLNRYNLNDLALDRAEYVMEKFDDIPVAATGVPFNDLIIGTDHTNAEIPLSYPPLMALLSPYLFPNCQGHYTFSPNINDSLPEEHGGISEATKTVETASGFAERCILMADLHFRITKYFRFFMADIIEKYNIASYNRHVKF